MDETSTKAEALRPTRDRRERKRHLEVKHKMPKVIVHRVATAGLQSKEEYEDAYVDEKDKTNDAFLVIRATSTGLISNMIPRSYILKVDYEE